MIDLAKKGQDTKRDNNDTFQETKWSKINTATVCPNTCVLKFAQACYVSDSCAPPPKSCSNTGKKNKK